MITEGWGVVRERTTKAKIHYYVNGECLHKGVRLYDNSFGLIKDIPSDFWIHEFHLPKCGICRKLLKELKNGQNKTKEVYDERKKR